jgi:hypothetical protein
MTLNNGISFSNRKWIFPKCPAPNNPILIIFSAEFSDKYCLKKYSFLIGSGAIEMGTFDLHEQGAW